MKALIDLEVQASQPYQIHIRQVLLKDIRQYVDEGYQKIVILTDENVDPYYSETLIRALKSKDRKLYKYIMKSGEGSKSFDNVQQIVHFLAQEQVHKDDLLIALGGGVVGDVTGFVASIYLRGMDYLQVPTSFLAAIDSSVGGKTAVNLPAGKNLVGSIKQPLAVVIDIDCFKTLEDLYFSEGIAEAIKTGLLFDEELFQRFAQGLVKKDSYDMDQIVRTCVEWKIQLVEEDEFDQGRRQLLNFGHTLGHAIEKKSRYNIRHGQAVAIGMAVSIRALEKRGDLPQGTAQLVEEALIKYNLPVQIEYPLEEILEEISWDKKWKDGQIPLALPLALGQAQLQWMTEEELANFLAQGWEALDYPVGEEKE